MLELAGSPSPPYEYLMQEGREGGRTVFGELDVPPAAEEANGDNSCSNIPEKCEKHRLIRLGRRERVNRLGRRS